MEYQNLMVLKWHAEHSAACHFFQMAISPRPLDAFLILVAQMKATVAYVTNSKEFLLFIDKNKSYSFAK